MRLINTIRYPDDVFVMEIQDMQNASPQKLWQYSLFNLILLIILIAWLWQKNQPINIPDASLPADGKVQCVSYSPYYYYGQTPLKAGTIVPKTQIETDLKHIAQHSDCVRIYSVSQGLDYVPEVASRLGLKVLLGAWIGWVSADNDIELKLAIKLANQYPETIKGLIVGNEVLLRGEQSEQAMQAYITRAKQATKVPVSYADVWEFWISHKDLEQSVDFVTVHLLPYWENNPQSIDQAIEHANIVMNKLGDVFKKPILIGETGWPSIGRQREKSIPSQINQARYIREFLREANNQHWNYNLIEAFDQPWKRQLEGTVGGYWGIYNIDYIPKFNLSGLVSERQDYLRPFYFGAAGALLLLGITLLLGENRRSAMFNMSILGMLAGIVWMLQLEYLSAACGDGTLFSSLTCIPNAGRSLAGVVQFLEWLFLGGGSVTGWLIIACLPALFYKNSKRSNFIISVSTFLLIVGAVTTGILLLEDGRYRDYPVIIYLLPVLQLSLGFMLAGISIIFLPRTNFVLSVAAFIAAIICYSGEMYNLNAMLWLAITTLFVIAFGSKITVLKNN